MSVSGSDSRSAGRKSTYFAPHGPKAGLQGGGQAPVAAVVDDTEEGMLAGQPIYERAGAVGGAIIYEDQFAFACGEAERGERAPDVRHQLGRVAGLVRAPEPGPKAVARDQSAARVALRCAVCGCVIRESFSHFRHPQDMLLNPHERPHGLGNPRLLRG